MKGAAQKIPVGLVVLCRSKHVECAVLLKQKGVVLVDQPAQVRPLGEQGLSVRPPDGEEDLRVVGVPHDRFHGDGHAVVGVAGLDDLCPVLATYRRREAFENHVGFRRAGNHLSIRRVGR